GRQQHLGGVDGLVVVASLLQALHQGGHSGSAQGPVGVALLVAPHHQGADAEIAEGHGQVGGDEGLADPALADDGGHGGCHLGGSAWGAAASALTRSRSAYRAYTFLRSGKRTPTTFMPRKSSRYTTSTLPRQPSVMCFLSVIRTSSPTLNLG